MRTASDGLHYYCLAPEGVSPARTSVGVFEGVDVRAPVTQEGRQGQAVAPGSHALSKHTGQLASYDVLRVGGLVPLTESQTDHWRAAAAAHTRYEAAPVETWRAMSFTDETARDLVGRWVEKLEAHPPSPSGRRNTLRDGALAIHGRAFHVGGFYVDDAVRLLRSAALSVGLDAARVDKTIADARRDASHTRPVSMRREPRRRTRRRGRSTR